MPHQAAAAAAAAAAATLAAARGPSSPPAPLPLPPGMLQPPVPQLPMDGAKGAAGNLLHFGDVTVVNHPDTVPVPMVVPMVYLMPAEQGQYLNDSSQEHRLLFLLTFQVLARA